MNRSYLLGVWVVAVMSFWAGAATKSRRPPEMPDHVSVLLPDGRDGGTEVKIDAGRRHTGGRPARVFLTYSDGRRVDGMYRLTPGP